MSADTVEQDDNHNLHIVWAMLNMLVVDAIISSGFPRFHI